MFRFIRHFFADIKTDLFHSSLLLSGSLVAQVIAFIAYPILTRLYSPAEFGKFSVFLSITGILSILATGRLEYALMIPKEETKAHDLKKIGLWWCSIFSVACLLITFLLALFKGLSSHVPGLFFISIYVFLTGTTQIFTLYRNRLKQYQKLAQVSVIQNAITSAGKILLGFAGSLNVGLIFGSIMGQVASFISISKGLMEKTIFTKPARLKETLREYSAFPKYRMVQALINTFSSNMPIFLIAFYFSAREAGYFGLILGLGYKVITLISSALYQVLYRRFTEEKNLQNPVLPLFLKMSILLALISIVPGIPLFFISQKLIDVFCGHGWSEAGAYLKIMLPWLIMVFIVSPFAFIADVYSLQKKVLIVDALHLLLRILGFYIGVWAGNLYLSLTLFSLISVAYVTFYYIWYYFILKRNSTYSLNQEPLIPPVNSNSFSNN